MTDPKFTITSLWKTRGGGKAMVVDVRAADDIDVFHYHTRNIYRHYREGRWSDFQDTNYDLLTPWVEPKTVRVHGWLNIYPYGTGNHIHASKVDADALCDSGRIACKELDFTVVEGEGL